MRHIRVAPVFQSPLVPLGALALAAALWLSRERARAVDVLTISLYFAGLPLVYRTIREALRGRFAADVVASLSVITAMLLQEPLAGMVVVLMQTGGEALERYAEGRASEAVQALEREAPRRATRIDGGSRSTDIDVSAVRVGDRLLVRPGEMIPVDAVVVDGRAHVDTARITGEPLPRSVTPGMRIPSGCIALDGSLTIHAEAIASDSQYERIVALVRSAQGHKAPIQRLADTYARWFTPVTLLVCGVAYWASGDATRVLSVLVVATPCPLLLAVPVAIIGGINRAARRLIVVRTGGALEQLAHVQTVVFDKTGTLTVGKPGIARVIPEPAITEEELLRLIASVEERSGHLLARSIVDYASDKGIHPVSATAIVESPGQGIRGVVGNHEVEIGARTYFAGSSWVPPAALHDEGLRAFAAVDGRYAGSIDFADRLRPGVSDLLASLKQLGIRRTIILSGDSAAHTKRIADEIGVEEAHGDLLPDDKVATVSRLVREGAAVLMVGDGTNDAPALSAATVGLALASHGGGISAEAADVVVLADDIQRVREAIRISRDTMRIARQSALVGFVLSAGAMCLAAAGYVAPVAGAVFQEALDVVVILNALRSARGHLA